MNRDKVKETIQSAVDGLMAAMNGDMSAPDMMTSAATVIGATADTLEKLQYDGMRVSVKGGDSVTPMGLGTIVGHVTVFARMDDGVLRSMRYAEEAFPGAKPIGENPKILLDNGTVVYGCQVWWEPVTQ